MPRRDDIESVLIIGAGPIVIGQACEFDYSGVQACKALREEGYRVVLANSNPATIMTDPQTADAVYIEPVNARSLAAVIARERPDALLPTMGGQTGLNVALELDREGVLEDHGVELIGARGDVIDKAEDRERFRDAMLAIGLETPRSWMVRSVGQAMEVISEIGYPAIIRPSFTLGGVGGGIARNADEFERAMARALDASPSHSALVEESVLGWKEFEMEVVRDRRDNCIIVCSIENVDPMGIHTGDSITVAPALTLTDKEYQRMRDASIAVLREIGVDTGGSNVQFAIHPGDGRMVVIEMNPRVSRSSALASKATGFPIAKVAAKLAVGYTLDELRNEITAGLTPASFEPAIDYIVTKAPRFAFEKFPSADARLTTQMKSVGEAMALGRTFQESLQKALRSLEVGIDGLSERLDPDDPQARERVGEELRLAGAERLLFVADALRLGLSEGEVVKLSSIDPWFVGQIADLVREEARVREEGREALNEERLRMLKRKGFADSRLARLVGATEEEITRQRRKAGVAPVFKRVDSCAAEFPTSTAYMYSAYEEECEADPSDRPKIMILGGGPNRIGQGIEFDYCCVHAALALRESGFETIMVNCNPETVSTDYDTSDKLYFEPLTVENVMEIVEREKPRGVIVQYGGQTPLRITRALDRAGAPIIGTPPDAIDRAEDRERFKHLLAELGLRQPDNRTARSVEEAVEQARALKYPLMLRPSYVLGGRAMDVIHTEQELLRYMHEAVAVSNESPVLLDEFLPRAVEFDVDAIHDGERVLVGGIMEHIEQAGVHSGDSACCLPPATAGEDVQEELKRQTGMLARALGVRGLMNVQFALQDGDIYVLEVNPRASRSVPYVAKAMGLQLAKIAALVMVGRTLDEQGVADPPRPAYFSVKQSVFPFSRFPGADPILGPEMKSTGEVMGVGGSFAEAYARAQEGAGVALKRGGAALLSLRDSDKSASVELARMLEAKGFELVATHGTASFLARHDVSCRRINKVREGRPHIVDLICNGEVDLIVNTSEGRASILESHEIRSEAVRNNVTYFTTLAAAEAACRAIDYFGSGAVSRLQDLHETMAA
ncbi:MAG: carbamoyl-phosphate synthase large subunit [Gammaproteobacteria bacterium]|nr:carbamoyl-phosphate synthase large subunit [Gammaproteobacteria bacterium]